MGKSRHNHPLHHQIYLKMADHKSVTWAVHVRTLCQLYGLPDPLHLLEHDDAWPKSEWKNLCSTKVRVFHEKLWRDKALTNSKMNFLNIQLCGLSGRHHPALFGLETTRDVERLRPHMKMLTGDYLTYSRLALDRQTGDPSCRICKVHQPSNPPPETIEHLLTECRGTAEVRERIIPELLNALLTIQPNHTYLTCPPSLHNLDTTFAQFILDCTSFNLASQYRISMDNNRTSEIFRISRDICFAVHNSRMKALKLLKADKT